MFIKTNIVLLPKTGHILKCLYDHDIVDEEVLISWQTKVISARSPPSSHGVWDVKPSHMGRHLFTAYKYMLKINQDTS